MTFSNYPYISNGMDNGFPNIGYMIPNIDYIIRNIDYRIPNIDYRIHNIALSFFEIEKCLWSLLTE